MHPVEIWNRLRRQPFEPIRIYISDGSHYDVRHPEMMMVTRNTVVIAIGEVNGDPPDRLVYCDPIHVTRIEPIGHERRPARKRRKRR